MDKEISPEIVRRRKRKLIRNVALTAIVVAVVFTALTRMLRSGVAADEIEVATVDRGPLEISISATGTVVPFYEEIIASPVASKVLEIYKKSGESLEEGDPILKLDLESANADFEKQRDELEMKRCKLAQLKVSVASQLAELKMQMQIDKMRLERTGVMLRNEKYLDSIGSSTSDKIKQAELDYEVQKLQFEQLKLKYENQKQTSDADIKVLELDYNIALKNMELTEKMMGEAQVRSPRKATLKWVNDQIGSTVAQGAQLAIVSDLENFKVTAEMSDNYADKVHPGDKAVVRYGRENREGTVGNVVPSVTNGLFNFTVLLSESHNDKLHPGLKVDVFVVNSVSDDALRLAKRSYYTGKGAYDLWVVEGNGAVKREVVLGENSFDRVEVVSGLRDGETVIVSDMSRFKDNQKLKIR